MCVCVAGIRVAAVWVVYEPEAAAGASASRFGLAEFGVVGKSGAGCFFMGNPNKETVLPTPKSMGLTKEISPFATRNGWIFM